MSVFDNLNQLMENVKNVKFEKENVEEDSQTIKNIKKDFEYFVVDSFANYAEDDYEKGEVGKSMMKDVGFKGLEFTSIEDLAKETGFDDNKDAWISFEDGRIIFQRHENENGEEPSENEIEEWKAGNIKLYNTDYNFYVIKKNIPSVEEMASSLGIQTY